MKKITDLAHADRPRERLIKLGARALHDYELLAILLGSGNRNEDVLSLSRKIVRELDKHNLDFSYESLSGIAGLGPAKTSQIVAAFELARRRIASDGVKIREPGDIIPLITHLADRKQETFICISLNGAHEVIASRIVTVGLVNLCQVHPREVFADPITDRACAVIVAHNHPSGSLEPSPEDRKVTDRLKEAAEIIGLNFLDHIIFSRKGYYSFSSDCAVTSQLV
jgi:DNA repair protein RadC